MSNSDLPVIAAFDFDGTLTTRDSLPPFLCFVNGWAATSWHLASQTPSFFKYLIGRESRQGVKEHILTRALQGKSYDFLCKQGMAFSQTKLPKLLKPATLERLQWHQKQGHRCVLISANIDLYLHFWGKKAGFHHVLCSRCEVDKQGKLTGHLIGKNCWGAEKVRRLLECCGSRSSFTLYAYGDSKGDYDLLNCADFKTFVR